MLITLIIDDRPLFLASFSELLGLFDGVGVAGVAGSGEEGLRMAVELAPDLVFVDLHMPGLDGLQVTAQLLRMLPRTRVVIVSWHDDAEYRARAAAIGALCKSNLLTKLPAIIAGPPSPSQAVGTTK